MKNNKIKIFMAASVLSLGLTSCEDFLDRPTEDSYVASGYYKTDAECIAAVDYLYNSPWYDFQRGFFKVGEVLSGNYYWGSSPYLNFSLNSNDEATLRTVVLHRLSRTRPWANVCCGRLWPTSIWYALSVMCPSFTTMSL